MEQFIYIKDFNDLKHGDYIKVHIIPDIHNIDTKITKEGTIIFLGTSVKNTILKDNMTCKEVSFSYITNDKDANIYIEKKNQMECCFYS
jgi:hypothetical protein